MRGGAPPPRTTVVTETDRRDRRIRRQHARPGGRPCRAADAVDVRHHQALQRDRGAQRRLVRRAPRRGARAARGERRRQVDTDEHCVRRDLARRGDDRLRRSASRAAHARYRAGARDRNRAPASRPAPGHDGRREHPGRGGAGAPPAPRSRHREGNALAARRCPFRRPSRGPRLVAHRRPPPPARAGQGVRCLAEAADPRRADGSALAGLGRAALRRRQEAGRGRDGGRLHHAPARRGPRDRRSSHRPARRGESRHVRGEGHLGRPPPRPDHRPHARGDLPAEAHCGGRRGSAAAGRGAERAGLRRRLADRPEGRDRGHRRRGGQRPAGLATRARRACPGKRGGRDRRQAILAPCAGEERRLHAG